MRVVLLTRRFGGEVGATTSRLRAYVSALGEEGAEVTVLTRFPFVYGRTPDPRHAGRLYFREHIDGARVIRIRIPGEHRLFAPVLDAALRRWARLWGEPAASILSPDLLDVLYGLLALPFIAVVHPRAIVIEQGPAFLGLPVSIFPRLGIPIVLQVSDVKSLQMERKRYGEASQNQIRANRRVEEVLYRRAASVITVTEAMQSDIARRLGRPPGNIHLVPNGAELAAIGPADPAGKADCKRRLGLDGKFAVLYAGSFNGQHDLTTLLEAARQLRSVSDVAFLLIGAGPLEQQLARTARSWGLENVFFYPGVPVSELSLYLGAADVGLSTEVAGSKDNIPSKIYLYMAGRLPVVATDDTGETRALVTRARSGFLIPPGDACAISEKLLELKRQPDLAMTLGNNGRSFVEAFHDRSQLARDFARLVLQSGGHPTHAGRKTMELRELRQPPHAPRHE
jgi:colanic acid biosynthesis glycosyl transferase WcaI